MSLHDSGESGPLQFMLLRKYDICRISELLHETIRNMAVDVII